MSNRLPLLICSGLIASMMALSGAEPVPLGHGYARDGDTILFDGQPIEETGRDDLKRLSQGVGRKLTLAHTVDAGSFEVLSEEYTKDLNKVYYKWISPGRFWVVVLPDADPHCFEVVGFNLAKDRMRVWHFDRVLPGLDPATLELVNDGFAWKDDQAVWYQNEKIPGADPASFERLNNHFYRDGKQVYWCDTPLAGADPGSFRTFGVEVGYATDGKQVWAGAELLNGIDPATFTPVHQSILKDKDAIYITPHPAPLPEADPKTFRKVADLDIHHTALLADAKHYYIFLPWRGEVFQLKPTATSLRISRTIWHVPLDRQPEAIGHSSAELTAAGWINQNVALLKGPPDKGIAASEVHLMKIYDKHFNEAWKIIRDELARR